MSFFMTVSTTNININIFITSTTMMSTIMSFSRMMSFFMTILATNSNINNNDVNNHVIFNNEAIGNIVTLQCCQQCRDNVDNVVNNNLVDFVLSTPLQEEGVYHLALSIISDALIKGQTWMTRSVAEEVIVTISLLLERTTPTSEICDFFCWHCRENPRSTVVTKLISARLLSRGYSSTTWYINT
ncbi:c-Maf-inducing protein [Caerostris extrusa]|uniref:C-Maf-inducing protein n=1 Tax=Caerostris extrusa TaxID=172846 RepID=A0AAV4UV94_CAEEX|nr:c-Maf-inducing protein [Caerostris extrusa]